MFEEQLARLRTAAGVKNDSELARKLRISHQSISNARKRERLPETWVTQLANEFGLSVDWILYGAGTMRRQQAPPGSGALHRAHAYCHAPTPAISAHDQWAAALRSSDDAVYGSGHTPNGTTAPYDSSHDSPLCSQGPDAPSGHPSEKSHYVTNNNATTLQAGQVVILPMAFPRIAHGTSMLELTGTLPGVAFAHHALAPMGDLSRMVMLTMRGDHLYPTIREGDLLLVDQSQQAIYTGSIYALAIGHEVVIKRLDRMPDALRLINDNPAYEDTEVAYRDDTFGDKFNEGRSNETTETGARNGVRIVGRVLWSAKTFS